MRLDLYFTVCMAAGLALRLVDLGETPLGGEEAVAAWAAWTSVAGGQPALAAEVPRSALLHGLLAGTFWLAGAGDAAARAPVALISMTPLLLLWRAEAAFGRVPAIALAALLAFDPVSVGYARLADGTALTAAATWAVIICAACASSPAVTPAARGAWRSGVWVAAGIGLVSSPLAWDVALPLALLLVVLLPAGFGSAGRPLAVMAVSSVVAGSGALTRWDGLQYASAAATHWLNTWTGGAGPGDVWLDGLRFEIVPVALGIAGLTVAVLQRTGRVSQPAAEPLFTPRVFITLVLWMLWGVLVAFRPVRSLSFWLVLQPPLFLGACWLISRIVADTREAGRHRTRLAPFAAALGVLAVLQFAGAGVKVAAGGPVSRFRPYPTVAEPGVRHLARDLETVLAPGGLPLDVVAPGGADPLLGWHLRDAPGLRWVAAAAVMQPGSPARYAIVPSQTAGMNAGDVAVYPVRRRDGGLEWVRLQQVGGGS